MSSHNVPISPARRLLTPWQSTAFCIVAAALFLACSSAPTPIYHLYREMFGLSPAMMTVIFAAYAFSLLMALLTIGSLSDFIGRRPMIMAALLLNLAAMVVFLVADSALMLVLARALQGFAAGAATTTLGAAILDFNREKGPLINSVSPFIGMAIGSLISGALVSFAPAPTELVYAVLLVVTLALLLLLPWLPEGAVGKPGAIASLAPDIRIPKAARSMLVRITPVNIAGWALGGFYLSLMPSLVREATGLTSPFVGALVVAVLTFAATATVSALRLRPGEEVLSIGSWSMISGVLVTLTGVYLQTILLMIAGAVFTGIAFGSCFSGALRIVLPLAHPDERAGLLSAFYVQSYLAFSLPSIAVGLAAPQLGLSVAAYVYGSIVMAMAAVSILMLARRSRAY